MPDTVPMTPEVQAFRMRVLEEGQRDIKTTIDKMDGKFILMHDTIVKLGACVPGTSADCITHALKIADIDQRVSKHMVCTEKRLLDIERKQWLQTGVLSVLIILLQIVGPTLSKHLIGNGNNKAAPTAPAKP